MAIQKITGDVIATSAVTADSLADNTITAAKLHTTLDLTGKTVTVATASAGDNDTTVASTAFVSTAVANLADSAPSTLDTLNELAAALGDDANFSTTVTTSIATKAPLASPTFTGTINSGPINSGNIAIPASGTNATSVEVGLNSSSNHFAYIDLAGDSTYTDYGLRLIRGDSGANTISGLYHRGTGDLVIETQEAASILLRTGAATALTLDSSQNATFAGNLLMRNGGNIELGGYNSGNDKGLILTPQDGSGYWHVYNTAGGNLAFGASSTIGSSEKMRITGSGNVGIGTDDVTDKLTINADAGNGITFDGISASAATEQNVSDIKFINRRSSGTTVKANIKHITHGTANGSALTFGTTTGSGATERMRIDSSGKVGIGTDNPAEALTVNGNIGISDGKIYNGASNNSAGVSLPNSTVRIDGYNGITFHSSSTTVGSQTERMRIDTSGSLVLQDGTTYTTNAPTHRGSLILAGASGATSYGGIEFHPNAGGGAGYGSKIGASDAEMTFSTRSNSATFTQRMVIKADGNVGIGTTEPKAKLNTNLAVEGSLLAYMDGTSKTFDANKNIAVTHSSSDLGVSTAAGILLANNNNSNNTTSPLIAFSARSASNTYNHTYSTIHGVKTASGADTNWTRGDIVFSTSDGTGPRERMRINSTGQILATPLGIANPSFSFIGDTNTGMTRPTSDTLQFISGGTEAMRIDGSAKLQRNNFGVNVNEHMLKVIQLTGPGSGSTFTRTVDVGTHFGMTSQGGFILFALHGWQQDAAAGMIHWWNDGNGNDNGISTGGVGLIDFFTQNGITITASAGSGTHEIDITFVNAHSNPHGWRMAVWA